LTRLLPPPRLHAFIDFDGTIALADTTDALLERHADPRWRDIEAAWRRGAIGSRQCMAEQVALLRLSPAALRDFVACVEIDPDFPGFLAWCRARAIPVTVVSDGLDLVVSGALSRLGLDLPVRANALRAVQRDRWTLAFPFERAACRSRSGHCKCRGLDTGAIAVLIGDGQSDFCAAEAADMVFAKGALSSHCADRGIAYRAFENFADLAPAFAAWSRSMARDGLARLANELMDDLDAQ
jgi:2-hydroxy-3-keto-5-methylthiopentenyl-1-phosphate phosphatase